MIEFNVSLAGRSIHIVTEYPDTAELCRAYLTDRPSDFTVSLTPEDLVAEREHARREYALEGLTSPIPADGQLESLAIYRKIAERLIDEDIILFHGSVIAVDGAAYMFTAKSGTGKSTHTRLWREKFGDRAVMVNDDKPLIEISDDGITVWGTPWCGKHRLGTNMGAPLRAIAVLERSAENRIAVLSAAEAMPHLLSQTYRMQDVGKMRKTLILLDRLSRSVGLYRLGCNMDPEAADVAYSGMKGTENEA